MLNHVEDQLIVYHFNKIVLMEVAAITGVLSIQIVLLGRDVSEANVKGIEGQQLQQHRHQQHQFLSSALILIIIMLTLITPLLLTLRYLVLYVPLIITNIMEDELP